MWAKDPLSIRVKHPIRSSKNLIVDSIGEPGQDEGSPTNAEDRCHMSGGQLAVCASNNHHRHLASMVPHHRQGDDGQSGEDVIKNSIKYF